MERRLLYRGGMRRSLLVPLLSSVFLFAATSLAMISTARAATGDAVEDPELPGQRPPAAIAAKEPGDAEPYSGQILLADAVGVLSTIGLFNIENGTVLVAAPYLLASPMVHLWHGHPVRSVASLAIHAALPLLGAWIGRANSNCDGSYECDPGKAIFGLVIGMGVAALVDAAYLARLDTGDSAPAPSPGARIAPMLSLARSGGATLGLSGTF